MGKLSVFIDIPGVPKGTYPFGPEGFHAFVKKPDGIYLCRVADSSSVISEAVTVIKSTNIKFENNGVTTTLCIREGKLEEIL